MAIVIHIGMQKTGTTALHRQFRAQQGVLLAHGLQVPDGALALTVKGGGRPAVAHHFLAHALRDRRKGYTPKAGFDQLPVHVAALRQAAEVFAGDTLLCSEDFSLLAPTEIARLRDLFPGEVRIVVFLRRQDDWIDSLYGHYLKVGRQQTVADFIKAQAGAMDYAARLADWAAVFGAANIRVAPYEGAARDNIWPAFFTAIDRPDIAALPVAADRVNPGLGRAATDLLAAIADTRTRKTLRRLLEDCTGRDPPQPALRYVGPKRAQAILRRVAAGNAAVAQTYLGRDDLFAAQGPLRQAPDDTAAQLVQVQAQLIAALARRVAALEQGAASMPAAPPDRATGAASPSA